MTCTICGATNYSTNYSKCREKERMDRDGLCFQCAFWELKAENPPSVIIDGMTYGVGTRKTPSNANGFAGRWFDIEMLATGEKIRTCDLWCGGRIPDRWLPRLPDTARFLNGAGRSEIGGITYHQESRSAP